jgi:MFS family permease
MQASIETNPALKRSTRALEATNFFLADVQTGLGPFLAAYLAAAGWRPGRIGVVLTLGGVITVALQTPAGAIVDQVHSKRALLVAGTLVLAVGAVLLSLTTAPWCVYSSQLLIGAAGPFLGPTLAAITMGLVGVRLFDRQFGRNQSWNSAGNVACALLIVLVSRIYGNRAIFIIAALLTIPTIVSVLSIRAADINYELARGARSDATPGSKVESILTLLLGNRVLLIFLACAFLFHFANAAMLPELGEMLSQHAAGSAAPLMSACIIVTQVVIMCFAAPIGRYANLHGRKPLLLLGFGVLPIRAVLYTLTHNMVSLIAIQLFDGIANAIFVVVAVLVVADLTRGSGRFNFAQGALATAVGIGAALSNLFGGKIIDYFSFRISFLALGGIAAIAFTLLWLFVPETLAPPAHKHRRTYYPGRKTPPPN